MEREIKFRGKDCETGEWLYGSLIQRMGYFPSILHPIATDDGKIRYIETCVDKETIGQYAGLKDKNGKEIYEGDIVLTPFIDPIFGGMVGEDLCVKRQVKFNDGSFVVNEGDGFIYLECFTRNNHIEICGNIHDNPELLKDGRD